MEVVRLMPCTQTGSLEGDHALALEEQLSEVSAMLCAVLTVLEEIEVLKTILGSIDTKQSGVTPRRIKGWWSRHKKEDRKRLKKEKRLHPERSY